MGITNFILRANEVLSEGLTLEYSFLSVFGMISSFVKVNMVQSTDVMYEVFCSGL